MITLCIALHLYAGPIQTGTPVTVLANECKAVKVASARKAIATCAKQGAERCEVIIAKDRSIILENKLSTTVQP